MHDEAEVADAVAQARGDLLDREQRLREHAPEELSHYSTGTADIEYAFPFLPEGEFGELEGIAHRGDFDLRSHMEGKLNEKTRPLQLELGPDGKPKWKGSGRDLTYRDDMTGERYTPHVIEPSAGADRATLAFLCEAYTEDQAPDENGVMKERVVMKFHPRLAPIKAAVFPLVKKDGMPEIAKEIYRALKPHFPVFYDEKSAVGRRYRRQDEAGLSKACIAVKSVGGMKRGFTVIVCLIDSCAGITRTARIILSRPDIKNVIDRRRKRYRFNFNEVRVHYFNIAYYVPDSLKRKRSLVQEGQGDRTILKINHCPFTIYYRLPF